MKITAEQVKTLNPCKDIGYLRKIYPMTPYQIMFHQNRFNVKRSHEDMIWATVYVLRPERTLKRLGIDLHWGAFAKLFIVYEREHGMNCMQADGLNVLRWFRDLVWEDYKEEYKC